MAQAPDILAEVFGFDDFRPGQAEIVDAVASGKDVLAIMPTGGGKSLCYQLPALMRDGVTVVISPLIALMRDQVNALRAEGVEAAALNSGNNEEENAEVFEGLSAGRIKLLYLAPERLSSGGTLNLLKRIGTSLIAVDEAHCVSQWGHDFRPDYLKIGAVRNALGVPLAAFTATADPETRQEIAQRLFNGGVPKTFLFGFDRPNIHMAFAAKDKPRQQILDFAGQRRGTSGIVYCGTRAKTETLAKALSDDGHNACFYHGGMERDARREVELRFQREDGLIVVATIAFGMGIDKPDIRWVAHADLPKSIESYYQEIGRAGRDGAPAEAYTLYGADDIRFRRSQIDESPASPERRNGDHGRLNALLSMTEELTCRRQRLLAYFSEESEPCKNCDLCQNPPDTFDGTEAVRMALSAILRTGEFFGAGHIIDVLTGNMTDKVRDRGHDALPTFGVGSAFGKREWQGIFIQMMGRDFIRPDPERRGGLRMNANARDILRGEQTVILRKDDIKNKPRRMPVKTLVSDEDAPLLSALKAKRRALAEMADVPAYIVFNDKTLVEMAEVRPANLDEMARIGGVGAKKLERYGQQFLEVITGAAIAKPHPARRKLAGREEATVFDQLLSAQSELVRGRCGTLKPLSCSASVLAKVAGIRNADQTVLCRILGDKYNERFGDAFLGVLSRN